jgi:DNA-directed RNA polymerase sigma subunit (sigma70/sigma32)
MQKPKKINENIELITRFSISDISNILSTRELEVLSYHYGLFGHTPLTLEKIGYKVGSLSVRGGYVGRERIRQIEEKALEKLKSFIKNNRIHITNR